MKYTCCRASQKTMGIIPLTSPFTKGGQRGIIVKGGWGDFQVKRMVRLFIVFLTGLVLSTGCASKQMTATTPIQEWNAPEWVVKGSGASGSERGKVFYGVASATGIKNYSLLRVTSEDRARNEVAKIIQFYTASLMKDYMASTMAGNINSTAEEQLAEKALKTVTAMTLSGVEIVDHWQHPVTGEFYALARLDLEAFKENLEKMRELDLRVRDYIRKNAERLHEQLEKEEEKMRRERQ
ncbi:MAG: hypothetical protein AABY78_10760 [Nitrospirota bacterium]